MSFKHNKKNKKSSGPTLDLHGMTADEAYSAIEDFIYKNSQKNVSQLRIMPGKGTGTVKAQVLKYLKQAKYNWYYERTPKGDQNLGVIIVPME